MPAPHLAVLGAGPTGLDAALAAVERGWDVTVYEAAPHVAGHVRQWGHVRLFTPWPMDVSPRMVAAAGPVPSCGCPTGREYAAYLERVAASLSAGVRLGTRVDAVARAGLLKSEEIRSGRRAETPFRLLLTLPDGSEAAETADVVLDCTGTYGNPNPTGDGGIPARGERSLGDRVLRVLPDVGAAPARWAGRRVLLVGAGNSAQTVARDLAGAGAVLTWAVRDAAPGWGAVPDDSLPERAALVASSQSLAAGSVPGVEVVTGVVVERLEVVGPEVSVELRSAAGDVRTVVVDEVVSMTGAVGDSSLYRQLQVHECYATEGPIALAATLLGSSSGDCLAQPVAGIDALRNPEPRFFVLGIKSYGRTSTYLLRVGWQQVDEVFAALETELAAPVPA